VDNLTTVDVGGILDLGDVDAHFPRDGLKSLTSPTSQNDEKWRELIPVSVDENHHDRSIVTGTLNPADFKPLNYHPLKNKSAAAIKAQEIFERLKLNFNETINVLILDSNSNSEVGERLSDLIFKHMSLARSNEQITSIGPMSFASADQQDSWPVAGKNRINIVVTRKTDEATIKKFNNNQYVKFIDVNKLE
jgi:hypothetical protein